MSGKPKVSGGHKCNPLSALVTTPPTNSSPFVPGGRHRRTGYQRQSCDKFVEQSDKLVAECVARDS